PPVGEEAGAGDGGTGPAAGRPAAPQRRDDRVTAMTQRWRDWLREGARAAAPYALAVPRHAPHGQQGMALAPRAGSSLEFKDHRSYEPGDDLRHIDWSAYARSDQLSVKLYREEIAPHLDLVLDCSTSMDLEQTRKGHASAALAAFFATAAGGGSYS